MQQISRRIAVCVALLACSAAAGAADITVRDVDGLGGPSPPGPARAFCWRRAITAAAYFANLRGAPGQPIVLAAADPAVTAPSGRQQLPAASDVAYLELRHLVLTGASGNGLNIDDGGTFATSHHLILRDLTVTQIGPSGNRDGIKPPASPTSASSDYASAAGATAVRDRHGGLPPGRDHGYAGARGRHRRRGSGQRRHYPDRHPRQPL